jgi:NAD(P)-dependent dehydrogenase (short-subunit alcohol dehydrogenase family)
MGGTFGNSIVASPGSFLPSQGGVTGLIKTLAVEWPDILCKAVDVDPRESVAAIADHLLREMMARDREVEVGYKDARRMTLRPRPAPLNREESASLPIDSDSVIMLTGGARGITAEVACELAARYRPTLILLGRTPLPAEEEAPETSPLISEKELKALLMDQIRREEQTVTPAQIEAAYVTLMHNREIRRNMAAMKQAGASVHYRQVDVRDERAFGGLIDGIYESHGRIDGVIHGAGIIEDKLIENKAFDSFERVFGTKVLSAFILGRKLRADALRFLVFFSSVSGRFGNRGQADYAAANDVLNKIAICLDRSWPAKVVAINWGPWRKAGMVSAEVERQFADRAMQMICPESGRCALIDELDYGRKGEVEVVLGGGPWSVQDKKPATDLVLQEMLIG